MKPFLIVLSIISFSLVLGVSGYAIWKIYYSHPGRFSSPITTEGLIRTVDGNTLISPEYPAARITFPPEYEYLGAHKFVLFGVADTEQYMFAARHEDGSTKSLITVQFESLVPEVDGAYDYSSAPRSRSLGILDFYVDANPTRRHWLVPNGLPGTDGERKNKYMKDRGYPKPKDYIWTRFAYVPPENTRKEMLIIQVEDLSKLGLTAPSLRDDGSHAGEWDDLLEEHLETLQSSFSITELK